MKHYSKWKLKHALLILFLLATGTQATPQRASAEFNSPMKNLSQYFGAFSSDYHQHFDQILDQFLGIASMKEDETCNSTDSSIIWIKKGLEALGNETMTLLKEYKILRLASTYCQVRQPDPNEYFFHDGSLTSELNTLHQKTMSFWDIPSNDIVIMGIHGQMLDNIDTLAAIYSYLDYTLTEDKLYEMATTTHSFINDKLGFDHPFLSFNAFVFSSENYPPWDDDFFQNYQDRIVIGDGLLEYYASIGYGETMPDFVYAHEFGHHIQYERDILGYNAILDYTVPYDYQSTELMADAFAGYYLGHPNGGNFSMEMIQDVYEILLDIGDCQYNDDVNNPGYSHGTPEQRQRSIEFGITTAKKKVKKSKSAKGNQKSTILLSKEFIKLFFNALPTIIKPASRRKPSSKTS